MLQRMEIVTLADAPAFDPASFVAQSWLEGLQCSVRIIRLGPGQALPPHTHGSSDLMLFVAEGEGVLATPEGPVVLAAGGLVHLQGEEELRVSNEGTLGLTLIAFLAPPFPPR
jgi:quercetin dioxygenase-like cupin family protein